MNSHVWKAAVMVAMATAAGGGLVSISDAGVAAADGAPAAKGDWPQWRGPNRDGKSADTGLLRSWEQAPPKLVWKATGIGAGFSTVSVAGERIFTMGDLGEEQFVFALSRADGKILWRAKIGPAHQDERGGPRATPTVDGDRVYALGSESDLVCLDAATGNVRWRKNLERDYGGRVMTVWKWAESPLVDGEKLVFTPGGPWATMVAVDKMTGKEMWVTEELPHLGPKGLDGAGYSSVVISNGGGVKQYVQLMGRGLVGIRASDGKFLWGYNPIANRVANIPTAIVSGDYIFAATGYNTGAVLLKLEKSGTGVRANEVYFLESKTLQNHHGGMVLVDGYVYAGHGHNRGFPICVELATGKVAWGGDIRNAGSGSAAVVYADGNLIYRYQNGVVVLIEATPSGYKEKGSFSIPGVEKPSWPHPVVVGGKLYLREQDTLYVYDLRG